MMDHLELERYENEGGRIGIDRARGRDLTALAATDGQVYEIAQMARDMELVRRQSEVAALRVELDTPLARAYRRFRSATTGRQQRSARSAIRRAMRQEMVGTMTANNEYLQKNRSIAEAVAREVVRGMGK